MFIDNLTFSQKGRPLRSVVNDGLKNVYKDGLIKYNTMQRK